MEFTVQKRLLVEFGEWKYYQIMAQTENDSRINKSERRPPGVATVEFDCSVAEGEELSIGTKLTLEARRAGFGG